MGVWDRIPYKDHARRHRRGGSDPTAEPICYAFMLFDWDELIVEDAGADNECFFFHVPPDLNGLALVGASASVRTPSSSGDVEISVIQYSPDPTGTSTTMLNDTIHVEENEYTSLTSTFPPTFSGAVLATGDYVFTSVQWPGDNGDAKGLVVQLFFA